ncbi:hypothetical protein Q8F55_000552 [Vanrija albida]|uniref:Uncharacterized protein n=1 Tax=Vanrija albida TaxID=181172 RepID=A0ABR3QDM1_9TREE
MPLPPPPPLLLLLLVVVVALVPRASAQYASPSPGPPAGILVPFAIFGFLVVAVIVACVANAARKSGSRPTPLPPLPVHAGRAHTYPALPATYYAAPVHVPVPPPVPAPAYFVGSAGRPPQHAPPSSGSTSSLPAYAPPVVS